MPSITPYLWFDNNLEEAIDFYTGLFPDARISGVSRMPEGTPGPGNGVITAQFSLAGQEFMALQGGPEFSFTPAISFFVSCEGQDEVDHYWNGLLDGGEESQCGWLVDRFGLSWQIVPTTLGELLGDPDPERSQRVLQAMLKMQKIVIADLQAAYDEAQPAT